jgi:hydroxypyruvate reductase
MVGRLARRCGVRLLGDALAGNDAHGVFAPLGDQESTGPTLTNGNGFRAVLVMPR